jgi:hypothetical protein
VARAYVRPELPLHGFKRRFHFLPVLLVCLVQLLLQTLHARLQPRRQQQTSTPDAHTELPCASAEDDAPTCAHECTRAAAALSPSRRRAAAAERNPHPRYALRTPGHGKAMPSRRHPCPASSHTKISQVEPYIVRLHTNLCTVNGTSASTMQPGALPFAPPVTMQPAAPPANEPRRARCQQSSRKVEPRGRSFMMCERARRGRGAPLPIMLLLCLAHPDKVTGMARGDAPAPTAAASQAGAGHQQTARRARGRPRAATGPKSAVGCTPVHQRCGFAEGCDAGARRVHFGVPGREQRFCHEHRQTSHRNLNNFKARRLCRHPGCSRFGTFGANASAVSVGRASATNDTATTPLLYCKKHSKPGERRGAWESVHRAPCCCRVLARMSCCRWRRP